MGEAVRAWLAGLSSSERSSVEAALARDRELEEHVEAVICDLPAHLSEAFLRRFQAGLAGADLPARAVMDGLRGLAGERIRERDEDRQ